MAKMEIADLKRYANEFLTESPGERLSSAALSRYLNNKGFDISARYVNRAIGEYIRQLLDESPTRARRTVVVYKALEIDKFFKKNNTPDKLATAIRERDKYYAEIAASAAEAFKEAEAMTKEIDELKGEISRLKAQLENKTRKSAQLKERDDTIRKLKEFIDKYINADIANSLLKKEGVFEPVLEVLSEEVVKESVMTADLNIKNLKVRELMEDLDE